MSVRANSLQTVVKDGVYFAALAALAAGAMSATVRGEEVHTARTDEVIADRRLTDDHVDSQLNTDDNMPSGRPVESAEGKREANMLGMKLYEVRTGHIRVDDVAATSPAWDAGIRSGDRLVSIDTLRPRSLAPWVKEVGRLLKDTPDGKSIAAAVEREGEMLSLRIGVPVSKAADVRDARQEERAIANMAGGNAQQMQQLGQQGVTPLTGGDTGGAVAPYGSGGHGGWGLGGFSDGGSTTGSSEDRLASRAVAQLTAVNMFGSGMNGNGSTLTAQSGAQGAQGGEPSGGQIGVAGFENSGQGVRAQVVVRGLPPGMYQVGIGQGDVAGGVGNGVGTNFGSGGFGNDGQRFDGRNGQRTRGAGDGNGFDGNGAANPNQALPQGSRPIERPGVQQPINNQRPQTPFFPQRPSPGGGTAPAGGAGGAGGGSATGDAAGDASGASLANPHGSPVLAQQLDATGDAMPNDPARQGATQPAQAGTPLGTGNSNQPNQPLGGSTPNNGNRNNFPAGTNPAGGIGSPQFVMEIGVLRVGQDGSGRVENQLQGIQVQNLTGMSVMVVSSQSAAMGQGGFGNANRNLPSTGAGQNGGVGMNGVVATGLIQVVEGRGNPSLGPDNSGQTGNQMQDTSGSNELRDRNRTGTPSDFNPRTPGR